MHILARRRRQSLFVVIPIWKCNKLEFFIFLSPQSTKSYWKGVVGYLETLADDGTHAFKARPFLFASFEPPKLKNTSY